MAKPVVPATDIIFPKTIYPASEVISSPIPSKTPRPSETPLPTRTNTPLPRANTPFPTQTFTPVPPASTPFPTFNPSAVTQRPPEKAVCPPPAEAVNPDLRITDSSQPDDYALEAIRNLNLGAAPKDVVSALNQLDTYIFNPVTPDQTISELKDLTGDGIEELLIYKAYTYVIGCNSKEYRLMWKYPDNEIALGMMFGTARVVNVADMNMDVTPEVLITLMIPSISDQVYVILEWDGDEFISLELSGFGDQAYLTIPHIKHLYWYESRWGDGGMNGSARFEIRDLDGNGTLELILTDHGPNHLDSLYNFGPWRGKRVVFTWDGYHFIYSSVELDPPVFRFQAVQDADRKFLMGDYAEALALYQDAIFSDQLLSWSDAARQYLRDALDLEFRVVTEKTGP